ncbi:MAG: hypothetical protein JOS17DRAFT_533761 [Linnemannia elongata]|nr:MAG: hypothetical protein JOS17DRAFT_533761 [Linnemannia elongata]
MFILIELASVACACPAITDPSTLPPVKDIVQHRLAIEQVSEILLFRFSCFVCVFMYVCLLAYEGQEDEEQNSPFAPPVVLLLFALFFFSSLRFSILFPSFSVPSLSLSHSPSFSLPGPSWLPSPTPHSHSLPKLGSHSNHPSSSTFFSLSVILYSSLVILLSLSLFNRLSGRHSLHLAIQPHCWIVPLSTA